MTDAEYKERSCERKRGYETIQQARRAALVSWGRTGTNLKVYQCRFCGLFHLTHKLDFETEHSKSETSQFVSSPNFSGINFEPRWDSNDMEKRARIAEEKRQRMDARLQSMRPMKQQFDADAIKRSETERVDGEKYISGKNRHKHKIAKLRAKNFCMRCGKEIVNLDVTGLCEDCRQGDFRKKAMKTMKNISRIKK